jgi:hypothetical protein
VVGLKSSIKNLLCYFLFTFVIKVLELDKVVLLTTANLLTLWLQAVATIVDILFIFKDGF